MRSRTIRGTNTFLSDADELFSLFLFILCLHQLSNRCIRILSISSYGAGTSLRKISLLYTYVYI